MYSLIEYFIVHLKKQKLCFYDAYTLRYCLRPYCPNHGKFWKNKSCTPCYLISPFQQDLNHFATITASWRTWVVKYGGGGRSGYMRYPGIYYIVLAARAHSFVLEVICLGRGFTWGQVRLTRGLASPLIYYIHHKINVFPVYSETEWSDAVHNNKPWWTCSNTDSVKKSDQYNV